MLMVEISPDGKKWTSGLQKYEEVSRSPEVRFPPIAMISIHLSAFS